MMSEALFSAILFLVSKTTMDLNELMIVNCTVNVNNNCYDYNSTIIKNYNGTGYQLAVLKNSIGALDCYNGSLLIDDNIKKYQYQMLKVSRCTTTESALLSFLSSNSNMSVLALEDVVMNEGDSVGTANTLQLLQLFVDSVKRHKKLVLGSQDLNILKLEKSGLNDINDVITNQRYLEVLSLAENQLTKIRSGTFFNQINLEILYLNDNKIAEIEENAFEGLSLLQELHLGNNRLKQLNEAWFLNLKLIQLNMSGNAIETIKEEPSLVFANIETLDMSHNLLNYPEARKLLQKKTKSISIRNSIAPYANISHLNLSYNMINDIKDSWKVYVGFRELDLSHNAIEHFMIYSIKILANTTTINLSYNSMKNIHMWDIVKPSSEEVSMKYLLEGNQIECDCGVKLLYTNKSQVSFYSRIGDDSTCLGPKMMEGKVIRSLNHTIPVCLWPEGCTAKINSTSRSRQMDCTNATWPLVVPKYSAMKNLEVRLRGVDTLQDWMIDDFDDIVKLTMSGNSIKSLKSLQLPKNIETLDLRDNSIEYVDSEFVDAMSQRPLKHLSLLNNPLVCSCKNWPFVQYYQNHAFEEPLVFLFNASSPVCDVSKLNDCDKSLLWQWIIIGSVIVFLVVLVLVIVLRHKRFTENVDLSEKHPDWDVLLSHARSESAYIKDAILPRIKALGLRVMCDDIHNRQTAITMKSCRCIVIVVSQQYVDDVWSGEDARTMYKTTIEERPDDVVLVRGENCADLPNLVMIDEYKDTDCLVQLGLQTLDCYDIRDDAFAARLTKGSDVGVVRYVAKRPRPDSIDLL